MHNLIIKYNKFDVDLSYNITENVLKAGVTNIDVVRYLKGIFKNQERFEDRFINELRKAKESLAEFECEEKLLELIEIYKDVPTFSYKEAFNIEDQNFKALVFGSVSISEMLSELGHERIKTDGILVKHKNFDATGNFIGYKEYNNIYEVHKVNGKKLGVEEDLFILKCWCTSTNKEHWLWIEDKYKDSPLEAIASTFRIHENLIPFIKEIKRQGDILMVEMKEEMTPSGEIVPLTAEQYFGLLTCQS